MKVHGKAKRIITAMPFNDPAIKHRSIIAFIIFIFPDYYSSFSIIFDAQFPSI